MVRHQVAGALIGGVLALALACSGCDPTSGGSLRGPYGGGRFRAPRGHAGVGVAAGSQAALLRGPGLLEDDHGPAGGPAVHGRYRRQSRGPFARAVASYHFGSLMFGTTTAAGRAEIRQVTVADQALASRAATARVRFFIAADTEGGEVQRLRGPGFAAIPSAVTQGELAPGTLKREAAGWGRGWTGRRQP